MRALINVVILLVMLGGGLLVAIALPESRLVVEDLVVSWPLERKEWITQIGDAPYQWAFYLAASLALLLWVRPRKRTDRALASSHAAASQASSTPPASTSESSQDVPATDAPGKPPYSTKCPRCGLPQTGSGPNCQQCSQSLASKDVEALLAARRGHKSSANGGIAKAAGWVVFIGAVIAVAFAVMSGGPPTSESSARSAVLGRWHQYQDVLNTHEIMDFKADGTVDIFTARGSGDYEFGETKNWHIYKGRYSDTRETYYAAMLDGWRTKWIIDSSRRLHNQNGPYTR